MNYQELIIIVNSSCIAILVILAVILLASAGFRHNHGLAACIIVLTTVPVYLYNAARSLQSYDTAFWLAPLAYSANTLLMPLLWLFTRNSFRKARHFRLTDLIHFLPTLFCIVFYFLLVFSLPEGGRYSYMIQENEGHDTLIGRVNSTIVFLQMFAYFILIFAFLWKVRKNVSDNRSEMEWFDKRWILDFDILFAGLYIIVFVSYSIWPRTDAWLIQILNVIAMSYLVYHSLKLAQSPKSENLSIEETPGKKSPGAGKDPELMRRSARAVTDYLKSSEAYLDPDLTLHDVSAATGIPYNIISLSINTVLHDNFFTVVNRMRIGKAKEMLPCYKRENRTIDYVAESCGFNSRVTFNNAFKRYEGMTSTEWIGRQENNK